MTEDEMVGWHHRLSEHGFGWTLAVADRQGGLVCCTAKKELPQGQEELTRGDHFVEHPLAMYYLMRNLNNY